MTDRVVSLLDMDCFYCQVEARENPALVGIPSAVVQYNEWKGGAIIAVNYEARAHGVSRNMRGAEAKEKCPEIALVTVPELRGKADLTKYRDAGKEVIDTLLGFGAVVERASIDEAYLDISALAEEKLKTVGEVKCGLLPNTFVLGQEREAEDRGGQVEAWLRVNESEGLSDNRRLAAGAVIMEEIRQAVYDKTGFRCSAGIAHNKVLAKLACGINKPNKQTILPQSQVPNLFSSLKLTKLRGLGGKLGVTLNEEFRCETVGDLAALDMSRLKEAFDEKTARWLQAMSRGVDTDPVRERDLPKSIGCSKNFLGPNMLGTRAGIEEWMKKLAEEMCDRLAKDRKGNSRIARTMHVGLWLEGEKGHVSRAGPLGAYDAAQVCRQAMTMIGKFNEAQFSTDPDTWRPKVLNLSLSSGNFVSEGAAGTTISIAECFAKTRKNTANSVVENSDVDPDKQAEELVPSLENYDPSILEFLPTKLKRKVEARVRSLREETHRTLVTDSDMGSESTCDADVSFVGQSDNDDREPCDKCGKPVSPFDLPEHLDFHFAQEMQSELGKSSDESTSDRLVVKTVVMPSKRKRGETGATTSEQTDSKKQRNILSFFQKR